MVITHVWELCNLSNGEWVRQSFPAFWIQVDTPDFDRISAEIEHIKGDRKNETLDSMRDYENQGSCFLLASQDLQSLEIMPHFYPFSGQWATGSPFRQIHAIYLDSLEQVRDVSTWQIIPRPITKEPNGF